MGDGVDVTGNRFHQELRQHPQLERKRDDYLRKNPGKRTFNIAKAAIENIPDYEYHVLRTEVTEMEMKRILIAIAVAYAILPDIFPGPIDDLILMIATAIANRDLVLDRIGNGKVKTE